MAALTGGRVTLLLLALAFALALVIRADTGLDRDRCPLRDEQDRVRERAARQARDRVGHRRQRRPDDPGLRDRHQRQRRRDRQLQDQDRRIGYRIDIYRLGYYGGHGARQGRDGHTLGAAAADPAGLPDRRGHRPRRLRQLGGLGVLDRAGRRGLGRLHRAAHAHRHRRREPHRLRRPRRRSHSDLLFQTSDTTWQAYNDYGGNSLYVGAPDGRAYKVSYNRPFDDARRHDERDFVLQRRVPDGPLPRAQRLRRQLHRAASTPTAAAPSCSSTRSFLSVGHDEYWSGAQRANVEAARDAGVNLAFFSGNEVFWKTRWEPSIDGTRHAVPHAGLLQGDARRTRRSTRAREWTGTWRDPRFSPPADGGRPENALTGTHLHGQRYRDDAITVPAADGKLRFWRNTERRDARRRARPPRCRPARSATSGTRTSTTASGRPA